jgi:hypothetical protein
MEPMISTPATNPRPGVKVKVSNDEGFNAEFEIQEGYQPSLQNCPMGWWTSSSTLERRHVGLSDRWEHWIVRQAHVVASDYKWLETAELWTMGGDLEGLLEGLDEVELRRSPVVKHLRDVCEGGREYRRFSGEEFGCELLKRVEPSEVRP